MSKYNIILVNDKSGEMSTSEPKPDFVAKNIVTLYKLADSVEKIYDLLVAGFNNENDFYIMLSDMEELLDGINERDVKDVQSSLALMVAYSKNSRWINSAFVDFNGSVQDNLNMDDYVVRSLRNILEEGEVISQEKVEILKVSVYNFLSAVYQELFNTYELNQFFDGSHDISLTRGFNEAATRLKKTPEEIAVFLHDKMDEFIFISNEVDRNPEVSKRIREQIPVQLISEFEEIIELITSEQVDDIINGRIRINTEISCKKFIDMVSDIEDD